MDYGNPTYDNMADENSKDAYIIIRHSFSHCLPGRKMTQGHRCITEKLEYMAIDPRSPRITVFQGSTNEPNRAETYSMSNADRTFTKISVAQEISH